MVFVAKLMKTPAILILTCAMVGGSCLVGCGEGGGDSSDAPATDTDTGSTTDGDEGSDAE